MEGFKEFQGKDLDSAIEEACGYFNTAREKLEIEILQDAKSGIFGIVGARKAKVRARRAQLREAVESILGKKDGEKAARQPERERNGGRGQGRKNAAETPEARQPAPENSHASDAGKASGAAVAREDEAAPGNGAEAPRENARTASGGSVTESEAPAEGEAREPEASPARPESGEESRSETRSEPRRPAGNSRSRGRANAEPQGRPRREAVRPRSEAPGDGLDDDLDEAGEGLPITPVEQLDAARLEALVNEAVRELVRPIVGADLQLEVSVGGGRVQVCVDCAEDSGLLIGREGQTLAALQYLISRVVSRGMNAAVRVQLDAGEYRRRQDEKLREMALALAEKVCQTGRSYSTRPLSSYHRRIVHVCLQNAEEVQTRSTGDGPMKRVVIMRRKPDKA